MSRTFYVVEHNDGHTLRAVEVIEPDRESARVEGRKLMGLDASAVVSVRVGRL